MADVVWVTLIGQVVLPIGIIAWIAAGRVSGALEFGLKLLAAASYGGLVAVAGVWLLTPSGVLWGYAVVAGPVAWAAWRRLRREPLFDPTSARTRWRLGSYAAVSAVCLAATATALLGYDPPGPETVRLASPVKGGVFYTVNGGYSILINPHMKTLRQPELASYRGQSYAVDLVKVDGWGRRAAGILPAALEDYFIYGETVYAPCTGLVAGVENTLPDRSTVDPEHAPPAGNFVLLDCNGGQVLLAHLMEGSVRVGTGEALHTGQPIARVGNSGRSTEPHLHLHAQVRSADASFGSDPLPIRVNGRILVRGSRMQSPGSAGGPEP
jgi:hypothetical protein